MNIQDSPHPPHASPCDGCLTENCPQRGNPPTQETCDFSPQWMVCMSLGVFILPLICATAGAVLGGIWGNGSAVAQVIGAVSGLVAGIGVMKVVTWVVGEKVNR